MAWDFRLDNSTGDLVFSPSRDIAGVDSVGLLRQRVSIRCKIPRGTYMYDEDDSLGSELHLVPRSPSLAQVEDAKAAVATALEPMSSEINVTSVLAEKTENNQLQVTVAFTHVLTDYDIPTIDANTAPDVDAVSVVIPQD